MPVTQPLERPGLYHEKFAAIKEQMSKSTKWTKKFTPVEMDAVIKNSLIMEAQDKVEFALRGENRRKRLERIGVSEDEFRSRMRERLKKDGYMFALTPDEEEIISKIKDRTNKESVKEISEIAGAAMKKILTSVE